MDFGFASIPAISVICYLLSIGIKATKKLDEWIPVLCGVFGGVLGVLAMQVIPDYPVSDYITAIALGIVSGLSATGAHQVGKQLGK